MPKSAVYQTAMRSTALYRVQNQFVYPFHNLYPKVCLSESLKFIVLALRDCNPNLKVHFKLSTDSTTFGIFTNYVLATVLPKKKKFQ